MDTQRIVLGFTGDAASCASVKWLAYPQRAPLKAETTNVDVIALIVDVGQGDDPEETYNRALACGAHRAHVVDRCDAFARLAVARAAAESIAFDERMLRQLPYPVVAAALVEVAAIEDADAVAHGSLDETLDAEIHARSSRLRVIAPAREWRAHQLDVADYVKMHRLTPAAKQSDRHLLIRRRALSVNPATDAATVTIAFESAVPVSVNGVAMELPELIESLSLLGGQYHLGESTAAPALTLLQAAYRASTGSGSVTLQLQPGSPTVVVSSFSRTELVNR